MSASRSDVPSQFDATQCHPEFGYLAPTMRFRRQLALTLKGALLGAFAGAIAMFFMTIDREQKPLTMLATPVLITPALSTPTPSTQPTATLAPSTPAAPAAAPSRPARTASANPAAPPVLYVPETLALPAVAPRDLGLRGSSTEVDTGSRPMPGAPSTVGASPAASAMAAAPAAPATKAAAKPRKKIAHELEHTPRSAQLEPEPRSAFWAPFWGLRLPIFGFGR